MNELITFPGATPTQRFPTTRSQGRAHRGELDDAVMGRSHVVLMIDFSGVEAMTISYADEFVAKFLESFDAGHSSVAVAISNLNPENLEAIQVALERRHLCAVTRMDDTLELIGDLRAKETFHVANALGSFRAGDLAASLNISPQNANNRLKPLVTCGALLRARVSGATRGGKEFVYSTLSAAEGVRDVLV